MDPVPRAEAEALLRDRLASLGLPTDAADDVVEHALAELPTADEGLELVNASLDERDVYYAIHDNDMEWFKDSVGIAAGLSAMLHLPAGAMGGLIVLLFKYLRRRVRLDAAQGVVLLALRKHRGGLTIDELAASPGVVDAVPADRLGDVLRGLLTAVRADGSETALVAERDGRWRAVDV